MSKTDKPEGKTAKVITLSIVSAKKPVAAQNENTYLPHLKKISAELEALREGEELNKLEKTSVLSLIAYASYTSGVHEDVVRSMVEAHLGIDDIMKMRRENYDDVVHFLVDLNAKEAVN